MVNHGPSKGCSTCRKRRVKCDEDRPSCRECLRLRRVCGGYGSGEKTGGIRFKDHGTGGRLLSATSRRGRSRSPRMSTTPEWTRQAARVIPATITPSDESSAVCFFLTSIAGLGRSIHSTQGFLEPLFPVVAKEHPDSVLSAVLTAVATKLWSMWKTPTNSYRTPHPPFTRADGLALATWWQDAASVDAQLLDWVQLVPASWQPYAKPEEDTFAYLGFCDIYPTVQIATIWNVWRVCRLMVLRMQLYLLAKAPPEALQQTISIATKECSFPDPNRGRELVDSICWSMPFYLGNRQHHGGIHDLADPAIRIPNYHDQDLDEAVRTQYLRGDQAMSALDCKRHILVQGPSHALLHLNSLIKVLSKEGGELICRGLREGQGVWIREQFLRDPDSRLGHHPEMAEALALVGLASSIVAFVDFSLKIIAAAKSVRDSGHGTLPRAHEIGVVLEDVRLSNLRVIQAAVQGGSLSEAERHIMAMATECARLEQELRGVVEKLKINGASRSRTIQSARLALRMYRKEKEIEELHRRILNLDGRIRSNVQMILDRRSGSETLSKLSALKRSQEELGIKYNSKLDRIHENILQLFESEQVRDGQLVALKEHLDSLVQESAVCQKQYRVIKSLYFPELLRRWSDITNADNFTNDWLFDSTKTNFLAWLKDGKGIYWISGKAGSGKSTLVKFAAKHDRTAAALKEWAGSAQLHTASFYFWNQGYEMQKSQIGLFQSLLYQILKQAPELAQPLCSDARLDHERWELGDLKKAFESIAARSGLSTKYCFFIDGLDEYNGDEETVLSFLSYFSDSKLADIKICVSSRPRALFRSFEQSANSLIVQHFTAEDMRTHVRARLQMNGKTDAATSWSSKKFTPPISSATYVRAKVVADPGLLQKQDPPPLDSALNPGGVFSYYGSHTPVDVDMVRLLLEHKADPNQKVYSSDGMTVWVLFLLSCVEKLTGRGPTAALRESWYQATALLCRYGADPQAQLSHINAPFTAESALEMIFGSDQTRQLQELMAEYRTRQLQGSMTEHHEPMAEHQESMDLANRGSWFPSLNIKRWLW
ncbi:hypothetical protein F5144DRAFT_592057 [Chaetomium tenue]|uniref:Uncharacterized protein n=1 Tax=Chaetomium tenue TaxID=1854479 RepID=A0ACB7PDF3_9PEZI|nr:hypothetical protein F5144DRAFT_592057 [Chaetomium globosum]